MNMEDENSNWLEVRIIGKQPERRAYHSSFVYEQNMYVFGGNDIGQGLVNSLWSINLSNEHKLFQNMQSVDLDEEENN